MFIFCRFFVLVLLFLLVGCRVLPAAPAATPLEVAIATEVATPAASVTPMASATPTVSVAATATGVAATVTVAATATVAPTSSSTSVVVPTATPTPRPFGLLFASDREGAGALYLYDAHDGHDGRDGDDAHDARDGRDGRQLGSQEGELRRLPISVEVESAWEPAISPDGERILFTGRRGGQTDIAMVTAEGEQLEWLSFQPSDDYSPAWSWDGDQVAWVSERAGRGHVWLMDVGREGEVEPRRVPSAHEDRHTRNPAWAPDGTLYLSAVDENGTEELYHYDPSTGVMTVKTFWPYNATQPAVNALGEVVFVGSEQNPPWRGLYRLQTPTNQTNNQESELERGGVESGAVPARADEAEEQAPDPSTLVPELVEGQETASEHRLLWQTTDWIGHPAWSADGQWILFTRWRDDGGSHDLWALPASGGEPQRVTNAPSWEADAAPWPLTNASTVPPFADLQTTSPSPKVGAKAGGEPLMGGFNVASVSNAYLSRDLGFGWAKGFAFWERIEEQQGQYDWREVDDTVKWFEQAGLKVFLRVDRTPTWARPPDTSGSHPPIDLDAFARYLEALARRYRGRVAAYEFWNEPNLSLEWGWQPPDPAYYVEMLRVARPAIQRGDPEAKLIVGALAVTHNSDRSMNDLQWMEQFYDALGDTTPRPYDAFSTHPYGFGHPPDYPPEKGPGLRRLEEQRALMEARGDFSPVWLTELGYSRQTPGWDLGEHAISAVTDDMQAQYMVETLTWIEQEYDFVEAVFFFNLDFSTVDWYTANEQMRAYAFLDSTRRPLPVFSALRQRWLTR